MHSKKDADQVNLNLDLTAYRKKRVMPDRRKRRTGMWSPYTFKGRRREIRRDEEAADGYFLDRYGFRDFAPLAAALALCALDLVANLVLHARGGKDPFPLTSWAVARSGALLVIIQFIPVAATCFLLLLFARFAWSRRIAAALILGFAGLALLHGSLAIKAGAPSHPPAVVRAHG